MFSKLTLLGKLLLMTTLIAYVITFLPLGITNVTIIVLLLANTVVFNTVVVVSIASNTDEWASFCLKLSYLCLTIGLLIVRSLAYTWDDLCLFLYVMGLVTFISVVKTYYFNHDIRKNVNKKLIKGERE